MAGQQLKKRTIFIIQVNGGHYDLKIDLVLLASDLNLSGVFIWELTLMISSCMLNNCYYPPTAHKGTCGEIGMQGLSGPQNERELQCK